MRYLVNLLFVVCFLSAFPASAAPVPVPAAPPLGAEAYLLQDFYSGKILAEKNADQRLEPASITKIMTSYVVFDALAQGRVSLQDQVLISEKAWRNPEIPGWMNGSRMFAEVNTRVKLEDLLYGLIVQSGNDASVALAEHVAGSETAFVQLMNSYAQRLGMHNSQFQNSTGWPAQDHYTTARDIAALSRALIRDFPDLYRIYAEKHYAYNNIKQANRNSLLWKDDSVDGIKTGHTESAGYCLAASAERDGMRLVSVVMGTRSETARANDSLSLLNYGFRFYETHKLFVAGTTLREARVWKGADEVVPLGLSQDLIVTIPRGAYENLNPVMNVQKSIMAPVERGQTFGQVEVSLNDEVIETQPLVALGGVARGNLLQRMIDHLSHMFQ